MVIAIKMKGTMKIFLNLILVLMPHLLLVVNTTDYDLLGREIALLVNKEQSAGWKKVEWTASVFSSGIYLYQLQANEKEKLKKRF